MKHLNKYIFIWILLLFSPSLFASHVLGGEITYKYISDNKYKVLVTIYRDCNGCKINGNGGGSSSENCSEIDFIFVKGTDNSTSKETKFPLTREKISDISPLCRSSISACNPNNNSTIGIELQQFSAIVDLDNSKISGFCKYHFFVTLAERNDNITTGAAKQNFCIDASIQICNNIKNNSATFANTPSFIINSNKSQYQSYFAFDEDNDSLVYSLTPALTSLDKEINYSSNFSYQNPITVYCTESFPCKADRDKETGFFIDKSNGQTVFIPTQNSEIGVVAVKVEEYRKLSGKWELIGYIKRDIQVYVKTSDGNNVPKFSNQNYFEICEEEELVIKIESKDEPNSSGMAYDTVSYSINSFTQGSSFHQNSQSSAPYNYGLYKWTPEKGSSTNGLYSIVVTAKDNFCSHNGISSQIIAIKVKPKENIQLKTTNLGCGNYEINCSNLSNLSKLSFQLFSFTDPTEIIFSSSKNLDTISNLPNGKYILKAIVTSFNGCETIIKDTINNSSLVNLEITGPEKICPSVNYSYSIDSILFSKYRIQWFFDSKKIDEGYSTKNSFSNNGVLSALVNLTKGKWHCSDTFNKVVALIELPEIEFLDKIEICHGTGFLDLKSLNIKPAKGVWTSKNDAVQNDSVNTNYSLSYYNDTILLNYEIIELGCTVAKDINLILLAKPELELATISICETRTPVLFKHLIKKPYNILDYNFMWNLPLYPNKIKEENGNYLFYPSEIGFGTIVYSAEIVSKNGCKSIDSATIDITPAIKITLENEINLCQGSGLVNISQISGIKPNNGNWSFYDFNLFDEKKQLKTDTCGQFEVTYVYDNYGCYDSKKITISIDCKPKITINNLNSIICDSELPLDLNASPLGGFWTGNYVAGTSFSPPLINQSKEHQISYVLNNGNCTFKEHSKIIVHPAPRVNLAPDKFTYCNTEPLTLSGNIANSNKLNLKFNSEIIEKSINNEETFLSYKSFDIKFDKNSATKPLSLICKNNQNCTTSKDFLITIYDKPEVTKFNDTIICEGTDLIIYPIVNYTGKEPLSYTWIENFATLGNSKNLVTGKLITGIHSISFRATNSYCSDSQTLKLGVNPKPMVDFIIQPSNTTTITQPSFWFRNQSGLNLSWLWDFGTNRDDNFSVEQHPKYSYQDTGIYNVSLTGVNIFGCSTTLYKTVVVRPDLLIFIPNAFSPNGKDEEKNNIYSISLQNYNSYSVEIFDRWGHKVFYSEDPKETWDGKLGGVLCTPDVYFYSIKINSITNHSYLYKGTITLIK